MARKQRRPFTADEKVSILRRHLLDRMPLSDLWREHGIQPTQFYRWQKQFFENGAAAFAPSAKPDPAPLERKLAALEEKLQRKNEVLSELMEEHVKLKKELGEP
jgi:transposase-like protein